MLLDRKRINRWAKWVALFLAVVFAGGFLFMGVGYGGAGFNLSELFTSDNSAPENPETPEGKIAQLEAKLAANPKDTASMQQLATLYQQTYEGSNGQDAAALLKAIAYLENAVQVDPTLDEVFLRLASIYSTVQQNDAAAVDVLNRAIEADPNNSDFFLQLGIVQRNLGHTEAAVLAWQRFLELAPDHNQAANVREQVDELSKKPTTTTLAGTTVTSAAGTTATSASGSTATTAAGSGATTTTTP